MKIILIDDEPLALEVLSAALSDYEDIHIAGSYTNPLLALEEMEEVQPDAVFLDIEMEPYNGLEMAQLFLEQKSSLEIVFLTAYSQYAVDAFEINAIDYLLKPIQERRLSKAIERLQEKLKHNEKDADAEGSPDKSLQINGLGSFQVFNAANNTLIWRTQKSKELFAYLWTQKDKSVHKRLIADIIFPDKDADKAAALLHTTIYQLRKSLKKLGYSNGLVYFNEGYKLSLPVSSDLYRLNEIMAANVFGDDEIKEILKIYQGDLLEEEGYHWAFADQQIYKDLVFNALKRYVQNCLASGKMGPLVKFSLDAMLRIDPLNENAAELMIQYYGELNQKTSLEKFYQGYLKELSREMGLKPPTSITSIYRQYMSKSG